jgi:hypothetical protein
VIISIEDNSLGKEGESYIQKRWPFSTSGMDVSTLFLRLYVPSLSNDSQTKASYAAFSRPANSHPMQGSITLHVLNLEDNYLGKHNLGECDLGKNRYSVRPFLASCGLAYSLIPLSDGI